MLMRRPQVQRTMKSIKALEASINNPEDVQPATKKAAQKLTNFRVSCDTTLCSMCPQQFNGGRTRPNVVDVLYFGTRVFHTVS